MGAPSDLRSAALLIRDHAAEASSIATIAARLPNPAGDAESCARAAARCARAAMDLGDALAAGGSPDSLHAHTLAALRAASEATSEAERALAAWGAALHRA